jgi:hypothetical protein
MGRGYQRAGSLAWGELTGFLVGQLGMEFFKPCLSE